MRLRRVICPSRGGRGNSPLATISLMSFMPLSLPTGKAPARTIFIPLYLDGLCDAVNTTPGISSEPDAKYSMSVVASPMSMTSEPWVAAPEMKAADNGSLEERMSCATTIERASSSDTNARPARCATSSSS